MLGHTRLRLGHGGFIARRVGHTDLPEAAALLAPRHLTFFARVPDAFDYTRHVYSLYGKPENFFRSMNIGAAVEGRYDHNVAPGL